jgi:hypothetical protein
LARCERGERPRARRANRDVQPPVRAGERLGTKAEQHRKKPVGDADGGEHHWILHLAAAGGRDEQGKLEIMVAIGGVAVGGQPALVGEGGALSVEWGDTGQAAQRSQKE